LLKAEARLLALAAGAWVEPVRAVDGAGRPTAPPLATFWECCDDADDRGLLGNPMPYTVAVPGRLCGVVEEQWAPDLCVFCCEEATTMVILQGGRHAVMMCDDCLDDDAVSVDDVDPSRIMLLFIANMN
jgi:hypothetical protein